MARTTRRREPGEVVNPHKSNKKHHRRTSRKNTKQRIKEIDHTISNYDDFDDDEHIIRGNN
jgi:hypothetical protein